MVAPSPRAAASRCPADRLRADGRRSGLRVRVGRPVRDLRRRRLLRRLLLASGRPAAELDGDALACRLMAHALLHRYSNLRWYLDRCRCRARRRWRTWRARGWGNDGALEASTLRHSGAERGASTSIRAGGPAHTDGRPASRSEGASRRAGPIWRGVGALSSHRSRRGLRARSFERARRSLALAPVLTGRRRDAERPRSPAADRLGVDRRYRRRARPVRELERIAASTSGAGGGPAHLRVSAASRCCHAGSALLAARGGGASRRTGLR